jgi:hypothetical protein
MKVIPEITIFWILEYLKNVSAFIATPASHPLFNIMPVGIFCSYDNVNKIGIRQVNALVTLVNVTWK